MPGVMTFEIFNDHSGMGWSIPATIIGKECSISVDGGGCAESQTIAAPDRGGEFHHRRVDLQLGNAGSESVLESKGDRCDKRREKHRENQGMHWIVFLATKPPEPSQ